MKLWLDDVRPAPEGWTAVQNAADAIAVLRSGCVELVSLDHDLGPTEAGTGYDVAAWIEEQAASCALPRVMWRVHSANPVGVRRMEVALRNADRFWAGADGRNRVVAERTARR